MNRHVFAYGTLMFPPVWHAVTGVLAFGESALLTGHARHPLRGRSYPGLVEAEGASVEGILHRDVDEATLARLDAFEGRQYERRDVMVQTGHGIVGAVTYVVSSAHQADLEAGDWSPESFSRHITAFLKQCDDFGATGSRDPS